jgi:hypothetical protein
MITIMTLLLLLTIAIDLCQSRDIDTSSVPSMASTQQTGLSDFYCLLQLIVLSEWFLAVYIP